jgi:hypothetical protein
MPASSLRAVFGACHLLLAGAGLTTAQANKAAPIGFVSEVNGKWVRESDGTPFRVLDPVFPRTYVITERTETGSIKVALFDGTVWGPKCSKASPCEGAYGLAPSHADPRGFPAFVRTYVTAGREVPSAFLAARSIVDQHPQDCVLTVRDGKLDLSLPLTAFQPGKWNVVLSDTSGSEPAKISHLVTLPGDARVPVRDLRTGVLALQVQNELGELVGRPGAVLLTSPQFFQTAQREFEEAKTLTDGWKGVDGTTIRAFLVRSLYAINALDESER